MGGAPLGTVRINDDDIYVYTDGACSNNGTPNAKAGYGIYFGKNDFRNINNLLNLALVLDITYKVVGFFISPLICCSLKS